MLKEPHPYGACRTQCTYSYNYINNGYIAVIVAILYIARYIIYIYSYTGFLLAIHKPFFDMHASRVMFFNCMYTVTVSGDIQLILDNTTNELIVNEDVGDINISVSLSKVLPQQFATNYRIVSGTASEESLLFMHVWL